LQQRAFIDETLRQRRNAPLPLQKRDALLREIVSTNLIVTVKNRIDRDAKSVISLPLYHVCNWHYGLDVVHFRLLSIVNGITMSQSDLTNQLQQAAEAADKQDYLQAVQIYTDLLAANPPHTEDADQHQARLIALRERGRLLNIMGERQAALSGFEQYYMEAGASDKAVDALVLIGNQHAYLGQHQQALNTHEEALHMAEALNDTYGRAQAIGGMGLVLSRMGRVEEALANLRKSLSLFEQIDDKIEQTRSWNRLAVAYIHLGQLDKSITALESCLRITREIGLQDPTALASAVNALNNLGECYQQLYDMEQALSYHLEALGTLAGRELVNMEADTRRNIGIELRHLDRAQEGIAYLYDALKLAEETTQPDIILQALYSLALAEMERGELERGLAHAQRLQTEAEAQGAEGYRAESLHAIGMYHKLKGETAVAEQMWQQALFVAHETSRRFLLWQLHAALAEIAASPALVQVHYRIASEVIQQITEPIADEAIKEKFLQAPIIASILSKATDE
jgi:tetratricopeptide (TPR) repeat protein